MFVAVSGIAPMKGDLAIGKGDQAVVGDGHAMGVAAEIVQHIGGATEGRLQVHYPRFVARRRKSWDLPAASDRQGS